MYDNKSRLCITPRFSLHSKVDNFVTKVFDLTFIQSEGELAARLVDGEFLTESSQNISFSPQNKSNKIFWEWQKQPRTRSSLTQAGEVATTNLPPGRPGARNMEILSGYENCNEAAADLGSAAGHNCQDFSIYCLTKHHVRTDLQTLTISRRHAILKLFRHVMVKYEKFTIPRIVNHRWEL